MEVHFDLSMFTTVAAALFGWGRQIFEMLYFDFFGYSLNGWAILIGVAILLMVVNFVARLFQ